MDTHVMGYDDIHLGSETEGTKTKIFGMVRKTNMKMNGNNRTKIK